MKGSGIRFYPLYWIYHDQWKYRFTNPLTGGYVDCMHDGHMHFFMMGFDATSTWQQAYSGAQTFNFELNDIWSPRADDPNKQHNFSIVGTPKWYFLVEEYWRRIYIQQWEYLDNDELPSIVGKRGIKYDASKGAHIHGPFREGKDTLAMYSDMCRTLPIEYWTSDTKVKRDHWLRYGDGVPDGKDFKFNFNTDIDEAENRDQWVIPVGELAGKDPGAGGNPNENAARRTAYPDKYYIHPTLEYMKRTHLTWERLPGWVGRDIDSEETGTNFGDGFAVTVSLPFTKDGQIQSPFSDDSGRVFPPGTYFHGVPESDFLKYKEASDPPSQFDPPDGKAGQPIDFFVPNQSFPIDGKWVEQCLGGVIQAKAKVILEDQLGHRYVNWVHDTQFQVAESFEGTDQYAPFPE